MRWPFCPVMLPAPPEGVGGTKHLSSSLAIANFVKFQTSASLTNAQSGQNLVPPPAARFVTFCLSPRRFAGQAKSNQKRHRQLIYSLIAEAAMWSRGSWFTVHQSHDCTSST